MNIEEDPNDSNPQLIICEQSNDLDHSESSFQSAEDNDDKILAGKDHLFTDVEK